jgi:LuxR family maltose regulon positive regulatory protein
MDEVRAFLVTVEKLELSSRDITALAQRTEGWAAGLQLAALSMQGSEDLPGFVRSFTGSNRYILDYLFEQVLNKQPDYIQDFLLRTAILDRFCAPLCDFLIEEGQLGITQPFPPSHEILEYLEHANLFLIPLDDHREWFRYHSLFADLLRHRLRLDKDIDASSLHLKASQWFEHEDYLREAVTHVLQASEWTRAADLIMREYDGLLKRGQLTTLLNWFKQFPTEVLHADPRLCLSYSWPLVLSGDPDQAEDLLVIAEGIGHAGPTVNGETAALRAFIARSRGDDKETIRASEIALAELPEREHSMRAVLAVNLMIAYWHNGQLFEMESALRESQQQAADTGNLYAQLTSQVFENRLLAARCQLYQAFQAYQPLVELGGDNPILALAYMDFGALYYEWNDFESSAEFLKKSIVLSERTRNAEFQISGHAQMARLMLAGGDIGSAVQQIRKSQHLLQEHTVTPINRARCAALQVQLALAQGDLPGATGLAGEAGENADIHPFYPFLGLTPARLFLAQANREAALDFLTDCYQRALQAGWSYALLEIAVLRALATQRMDDAMDILLPALQQGQEQGCIRTFADAGQPLVPLLRQAALCGIAPEYLGQILSALGEQLKETSRGDQALLEPLSERELQVMRLVVAGLSNRQIADQLVLSLGTVKTHIHHIYGKLDVRNRAQAIARVRELHLF